MASAARSRKARRQYICFVAGIDIVAQCAHGVEDRNASAKRPGLPSNFIDCRRPEPIRASVELAPIHLGRQGETHGVTCDPSGGFTQTPSSGRSRRCGRRHDHRFQLGRLGHRRHRQEMTQKARPPRSLPRCHRSASTVPAQHRGGPDTTELQEGQLIPAGHVHREGRLGDIPGRTRRISSWRKPAPIC